MDNPGEARMNTTQSKKAESARAGLRVRLLRGEDLENGFLDTLTALTEVALDGSAARSILAELPENVRTLVAERDGQIVGTATLLIERKFIHGGGRVGHIEDVSVHRDFQRQGIGTALVNHATEV